MTLNEQIEDTRKAMGPQEPLEMGWEHPALRPEYEIEDIDLFFLIAAGLGISGFILSYLHLL